MARHTAFLSLMRLLYPAQLPEHPPLPFSVGFGNDVGLTYPSRLRGSVFLSSNFLIFLVFPFEGLMTSDTSKKK